MLSSKTFREECHSAGYDLEEQYFHRVNKELIERLRAQREMRHLRPVSYLRALPAPQSGSFDKWFAVLFKPLPTGIYSFPV